jgi:hypothetical protein
MAWTFGAFVVLAAAGLAAHRRRVSERARCRAHAQELRCLLERARCGNHQPLEQHAHACHERGPGRAAAEAWYALGCALLDQERPEAATRVFQLACHAHAGLSSAVLLAFTCLKTRASDLPNLLRIVLETHAEIGSPRIPGSVWERCFLGGLYTPDVSRADLSHFARSLMSLPIRRVREQLVEAIQSQSRPPWAAILLTTAENVKTCGTLSANGPAGDPAKPQDSVCT